MADERAASTAAAAAIAADVIDVAGVPPAQDVREGPDAGAARGPGSVDARPEIGDPADVARSADGFSGPGAAPKAIRNAAVRALLEELLTFPKPGLVSLSDSGSHRDMDAGTFMRSSLALRRYFELIAAAGAAGAPFAALNRLGRDAEAAMLHATGGVNTHRGAIFNIGLLAAAAGARGPADRAPLGVLVARRWGADLAAHRRNRDSHGSRITARYGAGGAQAEAAGGFDSVYGLALPAYRRVLALGGSLNQARVQAFFELMARLVDTNLLHRGGPDGLAFAQAEARRFLADGGVRHPDWHARALQVHRRLVERWLSPGGSADLLAACLFVAAVEH